MTSILTCPVCRERLSPSVGGYQCTRKHTFDAARQGYVNFLLAHQKHSKEPGDSTDMIKSRRRFLDLGFYDPVSDGINSAVAAALRRLGNEGTFNILDAGCGEGFYLKRIKDSRASQPVTSVPIEYYGIDISKYAVRSATQRDRTMHWFVASIVDLPFAPSSLDIILNIFSMADVAEFSRVLKSTGHLVIAGPGPRHLSGLREIIYPVAREHAPSAFPAKAQGFFSLLTETRICYRLDLRSSGEIMDLLAMTPYYWNIDLETRSRVEKLDRLTSDVDVEIRIFEKRAG
jgi:23S rRNA (guanine745-N1)-methyltransferase